ncbi:Hsp20/alpha crystallin family protein [Bythopirellula polymerisocia]|uniref:Spore protein SP21 n=1 Tax=Bythopirellula polymerisocia TaxID=2528003 RepID=A0A5C6D0I9_9BACT|nr:Hsp20/alpha crystallin family protein [Bythopirellula polymerisocia]TWU29344.1 Spore protein SP21 [Bythopirellula polymerisocia]
MSNSCTTPKNRLREFLPTNLAEFDSLLNQVLAPNGLRAGHSPAGLWEDDGSYHIELDVPGVTREGVDITLDKGTLSISAERKHEESESTRKGWREERFYGKVTRAFSLPDTIDPESVTAELSDGVLRVSVAKTPAAQPRKIDVK